MQARLETGLEDFALQCVVAKYVASGGAVSWLFDCRIITDVRCEQERRLSETPVNLYKNDKPVCANLIQVDCLKKDA